MSHFFVEECNAVTYKYNVVRRAGNIIMWNTRSKAKAEAVTQYLEETDKEVAA